MLCSALLIPAAAPCSICSPFSSVGGFSTAQPLPGFSNSKSPTRPSPQHSSPAPSLSVSAASSTLLARQAAQVLRADGGPLLFHANNIAGVPAHEPALRQRPPRGIRSLLWRRRGRFVGGRPAASRSATRAGSFTASSTASRSGRRLLLLLPSIISPSSSFHF